MFGLLLLVLASDIFFANLYVEALFYLFSAIGKVLISYAGFTIFISDFFFFKIPSPIPSLLFGGDCLLNSA